MKGGLQCLLCALALLGIVHADCDPACGPDKICRDNLCDNAQQGDVFTIGDEVIIVSHDHVCITVVNTDGSYQVDYQDGITNDERVEAAEVLGVVDLVDQTKDCSTTAPTNPCDVVCKEEKGKDANLDDCFECLSNERSVCTGREACDNLCANLDSTDWCARTRRFPCTSHACLCKFECI
jgi:hypothetical protein